MLEYSFYIMALALTTVTLAEAIGREEACNSLYINLFTYNYIVYEHC